MEGLRSASVFSCTLIFFGLICVLTTGINGDCNLDSAEEGSKLCHKAFQATYEKNTQKIIEHPKKTGCCLSYNMGDCVQYAFVKADCAPDEHKEISKLVSDKVEEAQAEINKGAHYVGSLICGEQNRAKCGHLVDEYDKAKVNIDALNSAHSALITPIVAVICSLVALYFS